MISFFSFEFQEVREVLVVGVEDVLDGDAFAEMIRDLDPTASLIYRIQAAAFSGDAFEFVSVPSPRRVIDAARTFVGRVKGQRAVKRALHTHPVLGAGARKGGR